MRIALRFIALQGNFFELRWEQSLFIFQLEFIKCFNKEFRLKMKRYKSDWSR